MQTAVGTVASDTPVSELVVSLADARVTGLPVVDARERVVGVVSSTDLIAAQAETRSAAERDILLEQTSVQDIMTPRPLVIEFHRRGARGSSTHALRGGASIVCRG
ncbi:MAG: CBS domain-containing protein [Gemmatimonadales bacterium]